MDSDRLNPTDQPPIDDAALADGLKLEFPDVGCGLADAPTTPRSWRGAVSQTAA